MQTSEVGQIETNCQAEARALYCGWPTTVLDSLESALHVFEQLQVDQWLCRGQSKLYNGLVPSIDRHPLTGLPRPKKLELERQSIDLFRQNVLFFADQGEAGAMTDDFIALMVLRHYGVPTRILDWSGSPYIAAYFATCGDNEEDGQIWCFDEPAYRSPGKEQWKRWPETTSDGSGNDDKFAAGLTAFNPNPPDWFIAAFYYGGFHRQNAQRGAFTLTSHFDRDHADSIRGLLQDESRHHLYIIPSEIKLSLRDFLRENHGIWRGPLFPDSVGAADTAKAVFFDERQEKR